jgi:hypothetical protein
MACAFESFIFLSPIDSAFLPNRSAEQREKPAQGKQRRLMKNTTGAG